MSAAEPAAEYGVAACWRSRLLNHITADPPSESEYALNYDEASPITLASPMSSMSFTSAASTEALDEYSGRMSPFELVCSRHSRSRDTLAVETLVPIRRIGEGGQGTVHLAREPSSSSRFFAVKQVPKARLAMSANYKHATRVLVERHALLECDGSPFIATCHAAFQDAASCFFVLDYAPGGDLFQLTTGPDGESQTALPHEQARFYTTCIALALQHMHALGWVYRDLKLENVLVDAEGYA